MSWTKLSGVGQSAQLNIDGLVRYNGHWYMLSTDYRLNEFGGSSYDYMLSEVQDLQTMRRVHRGGPWRQIRYPDSSQWIDGNARGGCHLIVYKNKIYFATRDYSTLPSIYYTRVWCFDPRNGIGQLQNVHTVALASTDCYDAWPNDMCIHNDKLFIGCCDRVIRFDGVTWTDLDPFPLTFDERDSNGAYNDFVSVCSHDGKLFLSAGTYGRGYPDDYYDQFRIMVSTNDGTNWTDVTVWNENQYSVNYGDQWMACLTSFNGHIYMVTDFESMNNCKIYKLVNGDGSPQLVIEDHSHKYRMYSHLFTTRYDDDTKLYVGSYNSIKSMDVDENITTELSIKPYHPTYFINGYCDNETTGEFVYVGGDIGWVSGVNLINAGLVYYSVAYSKDFSDYPAYGSPPQPTIVIPIPPEIDPGEPPIDPINPPPEVVGATNLSTAFVLKSASVVTTIVDGENVSIVVTPETVSLQLTRYYIGNVSVSINEIDVLSLNATPFNAHGYIVDDYTHNVEVIDSTIDLSPISIVTQMMAGGSTCKAIWNFESGALTVDSKGHNDLTDNYYVAESTSGGGYKRGACAALFDEEYTQSFQIEDADLDNGFPLKNGDTVKKISTCCWIKPSIVASPTRRIFAKYNSSDAQCSFGVNIYNSKIRIHWGTGTSATSYTTANPTLVVGRWYHVGVVADGVGKSLFVRIWDDTAQTAYDYTVTPTTELYVGSSAVTIAGLPDYESDQYCYGGVIDELAIFNSLLSSSDIDSIRENGIDEFGDTQTSISIEQDFNSLTPTLYDPVITATVEQFNGLVIGDSIVIGTLTYPIISIGDSENLISNADFETPGENYWYAWPTWPYPLTPATIDIESTEQVYGGTKSGKVSIASERDVAEEGIVAGISPVDVGDSFTLSVWVYWDSGEAPSLFAVFPIGLDGDGNTIFDYSIHSEPCSQLGTWEKLSVSYTHTSEAIDWLFNMVAGITVPDVASVFYIDSAECFNSTNVAYNPSTKTQTVTIELEGMGVVQAIPADTLITCNLTETATQCTAKFVNNVSQYSKRISLKELDGNSQAVAKAFGAVPFEVTSNRLWDINDLGEIVGEVLGVDESFTSRGCITCVAEYIPWTVFAFFGGPAETEYTNPSSWGINNNHVKCAMANQSQWGYIDAENNYHDITASVESEFYNYTPVAINDDGVMLGYNVTKPGTYTDGYGNVAGGCLYTIGQGFSDLPLPPGFTTLIHQWVYDPPGYTTVTYFGPSDINNSGVVVGSLNLYREGDTSPGGFGLYAPSHGFIYNVAGGTITIFDYPGSSATSLDSISNSGLLTGSATVGENYISFVYDGNDFKVVNVPGSIYTIISSINNSGTIVGYYIDENDISYGFKATPTGVEGAYDIIELNYPTGSVSPLNFTLHEPVTGDSPDAVISLDFLSELIELYEVNVETDAIIELALLNIAAAINDVTVLFSSVEVINLVSVLLRPLRVRVVSPTDTVTITGLGLNLGLGPLM